MISITDPTSADAANKAVDSLVNGTKAIAAAVQKIAPHVWEVAVSQQRLEAYSEMGAALFSLAVGLVLAALLWRNREWFFSGGGYSDRVFGLGICCFIVSGSIVISAIVAINLIPRVSNPEYYAAKALLEAVR
jgi:hypothetical protein